VGLLTPFIAVCPLFVRVIRVVREDSRVVYKEAGVCLGVEFPWAGVLPR